MAKSGMRNNVFKAKYGGKYQTIKQASYADIKELEEQKTAERKEKIRLEKLRKANINKTVIIKLRRK